jgi:YHS domain-containing protein
MRIQYLGAIAIASLLTLGAVACGSSNTAIDPCAGAAQEAVDPCAGAADPGAAADPCAAAADPGAAAKADPCAGANPCAAADPCAGVGEAAAQPKVYSFEEVALRGADPVAYFTEEAAVKGSPDYEHEWNGATWRFSSAENRDLFVSNPEAYAPQYGGYCAKAVSEGYLASIDPEAWRIVDGKLYLNYSPGVQRQWAQDIAGNIAKGDQNWDGVLNNDVVHESGKGW